MKVVHHRRGAKPESHEDIATVFYDRDGFLVAKDNSARETRFVSGTIEIEWHDRPKFKLPAKRRRTAVAA